MLGLTADPNYSYHNNPLHYYANFSNFSSPYFKQHLRDDSQFFTDIASGQLPQFSWITMNEVYDGAVSDSDIGMMDSALIAHMDAIFASPGWQAGTTMVNIVFSDHGALWDHAAPYAGDKVGPGARVPLITVSPAHKNGGVNHYPYEHFSLRKMLQRRFGISNSIISPTRYQAARDFTNSFDEINACYQDPCAAGTATGAQQCVAPAKYQPPAGVTLCPATQRSPYLTGTLCIMMYSLAGNVDFPWSQATSVQFVYDAHVISTAFGAAVRIVNGTGSRTYTNRFGQSFNTTLTIAPAGTNGSSNLLYLNSATPFDSNGITWILSSAIQQPGHGPSVLYNQINVYNSSTVLVESHSSRIDEGGEVFLSNVPTFVDRRIGASNINTLAPNYATCSAPITFTNGLRQPTQQTQYNGAVLFSYSYFISDGVSYSVAGNLTINCSSKFATLKDQLGNPYQQVVNISGTRLYTYLPSRATVRSVVGGLSTTAYPYADQRWYPYSLLASSPGVYNINTAPFLDYDGIEFSISPPAPENGLPPGTGTQYSATSVYITTSLQVAVLTEGDHTDHIHSTAGAALVSSARLLSAADTADVCACPVCQASILRCRWSAYRSRLTCCKGRPSFLHTRRRRTDQQCRGTEERECKVRQWGWNCAVCLPLLYLYKAAGIELPRRGQSLVYRHYRIKLL